MAFKLEPDEYIVLIARRHWFKPVLKTLFLLFSMLIPLMMSSVIFVLPDYSKEIGNVNILSIIFILSWFYIVWNTAFIVWTNHFLDVLVVTNIHVIDINQVGLWHREVSTLQLQKVQDILSTTEGIIQSILNYGELEIQTAGSLNNFIVKNIQKPDLVRQKINEQMTHV